MSAIISARRYRASSLRIWDLMMKDNHEKSDTVESTAGIAGPALISRRNLLKKGAAAMPAVLTLQSGAALAASSAYIGSASLEGPADMGDVLCLDTYGAEPLPNGTTYRFVDASYADVYVMPDGNYHPNKGQNDNDSSVRADEFCRTGGIKYLDANGWPQADLPTNINGILVSSTALNSIGAAFPINYKNPLS
jgi:hypothetical protein